MSDCMTLADDKVIRNAPSVRMDGSMSAIVSGMEEFSESQDNSETGAATDLAALLLSVVAKNRTAFESLYDTTVQRMFGLAMRITCQQSLAEEVVSDVYLQVWQQAHTYTPTRGTVMAWLSVLCRSRALDTLRRNNTAIRQAEVGLDSVPEQEESHQPLDILQSVEQGSAIHAALGQLSEQQRQLVALAYFKGYTHSELATITNTPIGTVKTHLHRTMRILKELMTESNGGSDE